MDKLKIAERIRQIAERIVAEIELELVNVEVVGGERQLIVRVFIDKLDEAGNSVVTHAECAAISLHLGTVLDVEDFITPAYNLEVSSPGIERELFKLKDYERFSGKLAKLRTRQPIDNQRNFRGRIIGVSDESIVFEDITTGRILIPFGIIAKANLEFDLEEELRRNG
ncbi:MAG: ribosome maturation factor RimP [Pyrinomonadaceae bacterium]